MSASTASSERISPESLSAGMPMASLPFDCETWIVAGVPADSPSITGPSMRGTFSFGAGAGGTVTA